MLKHHKYRGHWHYKAFKRDVFMSRRHSCNTGSCMWIPGNTEDVRTSLAFVYCLPNEAERLKRGQGRLDRAGLMAGLNGLKGLFSLNGSMILCFNNFCLLLNHTPCTQRIAGQQRGCSRLEAVGLFLCSCFIKHSFAGIKFNIIVRFCNWCWSTDDGCVLTTDLSSGQAAPPQPW